MAALTRMRFLEHLEDLRQRLKWCFLTVLVLFVFFAAFQARTAYVGGVTVPYPWPDLTESFGGQFFNATLQYLKPAYVESMVTGPVEAFLVQIKVAFFLAILVGMPMVSYQLGMFLAPGLHARERRVILRLVAPSTILFACGVLLAFFVVLPFTFRFLYDVAIGMGVQRPLLDLGEFLDFVLMFLLGFGLAFQVPVVMYALTASGLVSVSLWRRHWRLAVIGMFFFGAIITPDGSGVTMLLVAVPMSLLYVGGYAAAAIHERRRKARGEAY